MTTSAPTPIRPGIWAALMSLIAGLLVAVGAATPAQASGQQIFDGPNGLVNAMAVDANGTTYLGGDFTRWGPQTGYGAGLSTTTATPLRTLPPVSGDGNGSAVTAVVADGVGGWYIGGKFTQVGGVARTNLAHILATGAVDPNWSPAANGTVHAMALGPNGLLYIGGSLSTVTVGGVATTRRGAAAINPDGTLASWNPAVNATVYAIAVSGSTIYVGGNFNRVGSVGTVRYYLAAFGTDGAVTSWNPNIAGTGTPYVYALAVSGSNVYVGGAFTTSNTIGGQARNRIAAIKTSDGTATTWNPNLNGQARSIAVSSDGTTIYVGGQFTTVGAATRNRLAAISATTGEATSWNPSANGTIVSALALSGNTVYVGGDFTTIGATTRNRVAAIGTDGTPTNWNPDADGAVNALAVSGATVYAGGATNTYGGTTRNRLAAIASDGTLTSWNPDANGTVRSLAISGSTVYTGGDFATIGGVARSRIAALGTNGTLADWNPNADGIVRALAVSGSTVYIGGDFATIGGMTRNRLAAFSTSDGTLADWNPNADNAVYAITVSDGTVYAGGNFTGIGGNPRTRLAAIGTDGTLTAWNPIANNIVNALAVSGSTVYVGGTFTTIGGTARNRLATIGTDGTLTTWDPNANNIVNALAVSGSTVYAGGTFSSIGVTNTRNRLAAFSTGGTLLDWRPSASISVGSGAVNSVVVSGSNVLAGGQFTGLTGTTNGATARNFGMVPAVNLPEAPTGVVATRGNASASVSWTAPTNVGGGITGYKLETAQGPTYSTWTTSIANTASDATTATVTGLTNGRNYRVRVTALSSGGAGGTSTPSQWFTPVAPTATPGVPTGLAGTIGDSAITASWTAVTDVGAGATHITSYRAFALIGATAVKVCQTTGTLATPPATTCNLISLTNGQTYTLKVRSFNNKAKYSDLSAAAGPYTLP